MKKNELVVIFYNAFITLFLGTILNVCQIFFFILTRLHIKSDLSSTYTTSLMCEQSFLSKNRCYVSVFSFCSVEGRTSTMKHISTSLLFISFILSNKKIIFHNLLSFYLVLTCFQLIIIILIFSFDSLKRTI